MTHKLWQLILVLCPAFGKGHRKSNSITRPYGSRVVELIETRIWCSAAAERGLCAETIDLKHPSSGKKGDQIDWKSVLDSIHPFFGNRVIESIAIASVKSTFAVQYGALKGTALNKKMAVDKHLLDKVLTISGWHRILFWPTTAIVRCDRAQLPIKMVNISCWSD